MNSLIEHVKNMAISHKTLVNKRLNQIANFKTKVSVLVKDKI